MKIISKYKDYYDYLIGKYGIDDKIILERTEIYNPLKYKNNYHHNYSKLLGNETTIFSVWFCDWYVEGIYDGDIVYPNELVLNTNLFKVPKYEYKNKFYSLLDKRKLKFSLNRKLNCPIIFSWFKTKYYGDEDTLELTGDQINKFPLLSEIKFNKVFSAEEAYLELYNWLQYIKPIEEISDKNKIESKGFDLKTSFRKSK